MSGTELLDRGREALRREHWGEACGLLGAADQAAPLGPADLEGLATAAQLLGRDDAGADALARAHQGFLSGGDAAGAARCAFRLGFGALNAGELGKAGGWLARAWRQLEEQRLDCAERGYLRLLEGVRSALADEVEGAHAAFAEADAIGTRFSDPDLTAMARQALGRVLLHKGERVRGVALLDEAMVAVQAGEVSPGAVGGIYCSVLAACGEIFDLRRAQEWTDALERWCASQPEVVPYRGHCLVRRAELLFLHGSWPEALAEARRAGERLSGSELGDTFYLQAEIHRLRGELAAAEELHREAGEREREPRPGFALLRLAQGQVKAAQGSIRQACDAVRDLPGRAGALDAAVESRSRPATFPRRGPLPRSCARTRSGSRRPTCAGWRARRRGGCCSWRATRGQRSGSCARPWPAGVSWRRPTRRRGRSWPSPPPAGRTRAATLPSWSSRERAMSSAGSGRRPTWRAPRPWGRLRARTAAR